MPFSSVLGASSVIKPGVCTSTTRPTVPYEGQLIYETDTDRVASYNGSAWVYTAAGAVVQVQSTTKTDTFTASVAQGAKTSITGLSVSITPTSANNKILVVAQITGGQTGDGVGSYYQLMRGATAINVGNAASNRQRVTGGFLGDTSAQAQESLTNTVLVFLDSPATTSSTTYSVDVSHARGATVTVYINRSQSDSDQTWIARGASTITVFEVAP
jgi:hypothetical protein